MARVKFVNPFKTSRLSNMKSFYPIRKRDTSKIHVNVLVNPEEIKEGMTMETPKLAPLKKPYFKSKLVSKITPRTVDGRIEFVFKDRPSS